MMMILTTAAPNILLDPKLDSKVPERQAEAACAKILII
jgi:hypothetical protein